jgi:hypothetical protein
MTQHGVEAVVEALNAAGVRYLIAGGLAVVAHGYMRLTADIDVVLDLEPENARRAMEALAALGYRPAAPVRAEDFADAETRRAWVTEKHMKVFSLRKDELAPTAVDVFVEAPFDFVEEYASAPRFELRPGLEAPFVGLDRLIAMKEAAGREVDAIDLVHLRRIRDERASERS